MSQRKYFILAAAGEKCFIPYVDILIEQLALQSLPVLMQSQLQLVKSNPAFNYQLLDMITRHFITARLFKHSTATRKLY